jgi:hypothetical protein
MPISPPTPEVQNFLQALAGFMENPPRDLPDGALDSIKELDHTLRGYTGGSAEAPSAGEREAIQAQVGKEVSPGMADYKNAATGADKPSPGQREYEAAIAEASKALSSVGPGQAD